MVLSFIKKMLLLAPKTQRLGGVYNTSERLVGGGGGGEEVGAGKESFKVFLNSYLQDKKTLKAQLVLL